MINTIASFLKHSSERFPDKAAFRDYEKCITFSELEQRAHVLAGVIHKKLNGFTKQPVAVYLPKGIDCITAFMGVILSGNFYTPLDTRLPEEKLKKMLGILQPRVVISNTEQILFPAIAPDAIMLDIMQADAGREEYNFLESIAASIVDTDILYVMFTSGSTGEPKGVTISHRAVIDYTDWLSETFSFDQDTIFGNQAPFFFDNSVLDIYSALRNGCEMLIIPEEMFLSPKRLCRYLDENKVNTIFWVPSALSLVANSGILEESAPKSLKKIMFAGEVMPVKQLNRWRHSLPEALYVNLYGPTEIAVDCTYYIVDREFDDSENLPIGKNCKNTSIMVLNERDELVSTGEPGELCVRGSCLSNGYYGNPEKTEKVFVQNPLNNKYPEIIYRTGDIVSYNQLGELLYLGRNDSQIKHMGYRIELGEIEAAAAAWGTEQCCALYDNEKKAIILFVSPSDINKKDLYSHLKRLLPNYMLPELIIAEHSLPLNQNGKMDRTALTEKWKGLK